MNANGLYNGLDAGAAMGVYNGTNGGARAGLVGNEQNAKLRLLDRYPGAAAAYSLRKLSVNYNGPAIRVRRSSDNAEQDIGFNGNGDLDEASLLTFVGINSGFVTTWYSQGSTASANFTQSTIASQPRIVNAGVVDRESGKPSIFFDGSNDFMDVATSTALFNYLHNGTVGFLSFVAKFGTSSNPNNAYVLIDNKRTNAGDRGYSFFYDDRVIVPRSDAYVVFVANSSATVLNNIVSDAIQPNKLNLITQINDPSNTVAANKNIGYVNNGGEIKGNTATSAVSTGNAIDNLRLGSVSNSLLLPLLGNVSEVILWPVDNTYNRLAIQSNINSYYKIY
jgi:hypothetical protein